MRSERFKGWQAALRSDGERYKRPYAAVALLRLLLCVVVGQGRARVTAHQVAPLRCAGLAEWIVKRPS